MGGVSTIQLILVIIAFATPGFSVVPGAGMVGSRAGHVIDCISNNGANIQVVSERSNLDTLLARLRYLCQQFPNATITITSGFREREHNESTSVVSNSRHRVGDALDFRISANAEQVQRVLGSFPGGRGSYGNGIYHIDLGPNRCWSEMTSYCRETRMLAEGFERELRTQDQREAVLLGRVTPVAGNSPPPPPAAAVTPQVASSVEPYLASGMPSLRTDDDRRAAMARQPDNTMAMLSILNMGASTLANSRQNSTGTAARAAAAQAEAANRAPASQATPPANQPMLISLQTPSPSPTAANRSGASALPGASAPEAPLNTSGASAAPSTSPPMPKAPEEDFEISADQSQPFKSILAPRLCVPAASSPAQYCHQNYALALQARECLLRLRQADVVGGAVMWDKSAHGGSDKQQITYRHSAYDYRVSETLNSRKSARWQQELLEVRSYLARRVLPEDTAPAAAANEPCWRDTGRAIENVIREMERKIIEYGAGQGASGALKANTKQKEIDVGDLLY